jgi:AraC-like DNA-binding protein
VSLLYEEREVPSPYIATILQGHTTEDGSTIRPAEHHWHLVLVRHMGQVRAIVTGPWTTAGVTHWERDAEILWIKFKPGTFMPHLPFGALLNRETTLPLASSRAFWLNGSVWQIPDFDYADTFVERLVRAELLVRDPLVETTLQGQVQDVAPRTVRHRFLQATGLNQTFIQQLERAQRAEALLRQNASIADTVYKAGYFDQAHLTKALKNFIGYTPAQIARLSSAEPLAVSYKTS